ncbi:uncharacterized protein LOC133315020, partial [Gastrolobium bilobum]|uniref:uncharacterized protein LOC133315020 n=1 Tax=Gastrolobium bilobum TaxID=150636 RepID=UPI002AB174CF
MSSKYDFLKDVNPAKEDWRIKVKVVRTWKVPNFQRKNLEDNLEMVLLDEQGGRIHTTVKDVIGLISRIGKVCDRVVSGRKTKMVVLELDDLRGHKLECTLWEHYVDEVQSFLADNDDPHNVLIVQLGRIKCFRGKVGITNTKYTTRIVMDSKLNEIVEFKKCLSIDGVESSTRMTQLSTQSSYSFENDFLKETEKKSISDVKLCVEVTTCITYGTIKAIESKYNWWYKSCKKCPFSVYEDFEKWYYSASFILFDRDCVSLLGMSAAELRELHFKRGADLDQFPNELNVLNEKSMLFKIKVKQKDLNTNSEPKYQVVTSAFIKSLIDPNDEANFDNARENEVVSPELEKVA